MTETMVEAALELRDVAVDLDGTPKLRGVDLTVRPGEIHALLGPNGAGKSTLMRAITRQVPMRTGTVRVFGHQLPRTTHGIARDGVVLAPQNHPIFPSLTVADSLRLRGDSDIGDSMSLFPGLEPILKRRADRLSGGQRQMLSMAMSLRLNPRLLMLDEPSSGLAPRVVATVFDAIRDVRERGISVLMVEQNAAQTLSFADSASLLEEGRVTLTGDAAALHDDPHVRSAYLGI